MGRQPGALTLSEDDRRVLAVWAADCAERTLSLFEAQAPTRSATAHRPQPTVAPAAQPTRVRHVGECGMKRAAGGYQPRPVLHRAWLAFDAFPRCPSVRQPCAGDGPAWPGNPEARAFQPGEELGAPGRPLHQDAPWGSAAGLSTTSPTCQVVPSPPGSSRAGPEAPNAEPTAAVRPTCMHILEKPRNRGRQHSRRHHWWHTARVQPGAVGQLVAGAALVVDRRGARDAAMRAWVVHRIPRPVASPDGGC